jgi:hypothetical protein
MDKKIIAGETGSIDEFRNYRDVNSDASFGIKGQPNRNTIFYNKYTRKQRDL